MSKSVCRPRPASILLLKDERVRYRFGDQHQIETVMLTIPDLVPVPSRI